MKRLNQALVIASFLALPLVSHAADTKPVTRAEVRAELYAAARAGQYPQSYAHYPDAAPDAAVTYAARKAQARDEAATAAAVNGAGGSVETSYGPSENGSASAGSRVTGVSTGVYAQPGVGNLYRHH
jgi:Domain of unknown function (DUF4148)